ncbi:porin family protein [Pontibacter sp. H249]|uniref:porin family protein n=1 Tax=Pontibacter sp. H249 TaxID=3133420 RepID=UPI0030C61A91
MKKILTLVLLALITTVTAQAQMQAPGIGIRAGANYSGFNGDDVDNLDRMFGFHAGLTSQFYLTSDNFFAIQPELLFSTKGAESDDDTFKYKISYIDVPVLARVNAGPLYFEGGPQASFRIGGDIESNGINIDDDLDQFKRTSFGYAAGIGLSATPLGLSVGVRYNGDISKLYDNANVSDARNNVFMLTLAYMFTGR